MTDPYIIAGGIASAPLVLDAAKRLLGPSLDMLGDGIKNGLANRKSNIHKVAELADAKANTSEPGSIPPRVAAEVFDKAQWADDEFVTEYLSGVLASARTPDGKDDSGVSWTALVARLSSAQLKLHYILYSTGRHHLLGRSIDMTNELDDFPIFLPLIPVVEALGGPAAFNEGMMNLTREGLVSDRQDIDPDGALAAPGKEIPEGPAMCYRLNLAGLMLFMRGGGSRSTRVTAVTDESVALFFDAVADIPVPIPGSALRAELPDLYGDDSGAQPA